RDARGVRQRLGAGRPDLQEPQLPDRDHPRRRDRDPDGDRLRRLPLHDPANGDAVDAEGAGMIPAGSVGGAIEFIFEPQPSNVTGGKLVGGSSQTVELALTQLEVTLLALALALVVAMPIGLWLGHRGTGGFFAVAIGNAGRGIPELALIAL